VEQWDLRDGRGVQKKERKRGMGSPSGMLVCLFLWL
jgi:hypothetical protein